VNDLADTKWMVPFRPWNAIWGPMLRILKKWRKMGEKKIPFDSLDHAAKAYYQK
jgi:hypothetical protein